MTTPTKEQIEKIDKKMPDSIVGLIDGAWTDEEIIQFIIIEWEKIRNSPK